MRAHEYLNRLIGLALMLVLDILLQQSVQVLYAQEPMDETTQEFLDVHISDSVLLHETHPVIFAVARTVLTRQERQWIDTTLLPSLSVIGPHGILLGRAAASPEGPLSFNHYLALGRRDAVIDYCRRKGLDLSRVQFEVVDEEYDLLVQMMRERGDVAYETVRDIVERCGDNIILTKSQLKAQDDGLLWKRLLREYFPSLRAVRILAFDYDSMFKPHVLPVTDLSSPFDIHLMADRPIQDWLSCRFDYPLLAPSIERQHRREMWAIKTNLLEWGAYVPQYGWCPMPNVELEYYPRHGHWTFGGTFDCPWWIGNTTNHKYFELRNYQLYSRYYFRNSDRSYLDLQHTQPKGEAAFRGFYAEVYAQAFLYQIGFTAKKGWIGEGYGGGLGVGYVLPISRDGHWRLDFGFQLGYLRTQYDPFVYGKPVYHGGEIDGLYYYNTPLYRNEFVKRQHLYTWLGPTRVGISISYDLLYRQKNKKRPSFSKWEKGGAL